MTMYNANAKKYDINERYFDTWTPNMAYVLGYITADGNISKDKYRLRISSIDKDILEQINKELFSNRPIRKEHNSNGEWYTLCVDNIHIYESLIKLGITPDKSKTVQISYIPSEYKFDFMRGYFDGDGCVYEVNRKDSHIPTLCTDIATASPMMAEQLFDIIKCTTNKGHTFVKQIRKKDGLIILKGSSIVSQRLYNKMYYQGCICLKRKKDKFDAILLKRKSNRVKKASEYHKV